jgi:hypothetical protein
MIYLISSYLAEYFQTRWLQKSKFFIWNIYFAPPPPSYAPAEQNPFWESDQEILILLVLIHIRGWADPSAIVRPEGLRQRKIPVTPSGMEPTTFRQCFNQLRHRAPIKEYKLKLYWLSQRK